MPFKTIVTELLWFLRGDTNIKFLVDNNCHIWDGDAYKNYRNNLKADHGDGTDWMARDIDFQYLTQEEFINKIKTDDEFAKKWGDLGPIYGKQWREWTYLTREQKEDVDGIDELICGADMWDGIRHYRTFDQIANLINDLKTNPDSRRLMVNAWNVGELDQMVLPPCHYGFQVYTRELSLDERKNILRKTQQSAIQLAIAETSTFEFDNEKLPKDEVINMLFTTHNIPTRAISLMWNQRSVDTFLGLPFNIASYGLLLEIIAKAVNMVPDELIGNLGDVHLYSNHVEQAKEQIGRELTLDERKQIAENEGWYERDNFLESLKNISDDTAFVFNLFEIQKRTREPFPLPKLKINTEFWPTESGSCGEGPIDAIAVFNGFSDDNFCKCLLEEDLQLYDYKSHPTIKAPLSN